MRPLTPFSFLDRKKTPPARNSSLFMDDGQEDIAMQSPDTTLSPLIAPLAPTCVQKKQVEQAAAGELDITLLYQQNADRIYRYHLARTGNPDDAQDLTAETFRAALESLDRYRPSSGPPAAWLAGIARHKLLDHFRRARSLISLDALENTSYPPVHNQVVDVEDQACLRLDLALVTRCMRHMSSERAEAIALHYFAGLSLAEAGQVMGKSLGAVTKLVQRGLDDIKAEMLDNKEDGPITPKKSLFARARKEVQR